MKASKKLLNEYPIIGKSFKARYPFRLGTTSFIYPDDYIPNIKLLGPFVDEIELLLFERRPALALLRGPVIAELAHLSRDLKLTYNVHLPTDIDLGSPVEADRRQAVDTVVRIIEGTAPLSPTGFALHVPFKGYNRRRDEMHRWSDTVRRSLGMLLSAGIPGDLLAIESLDYPLETIGDILIDLNLAVCLDIGHLIVHGYGLQSICDRFGDRITMIHLHGADGKRDHLPLECLPQEWIAPVFEFLAQFRGSVSLEVFSFDFLVASLNFLESCVEFYD